MKARAPSLGQKDQLHLGVYVGALSRVLAVRRRSLDDFDFELHGQFLGGIAGCIVASLIPQFTMNHVTRREDACQRVYLDRHREFSGIDT